MEPPAVLRLKSLSERSEPNGERVASIRALPKKSEIVRFSADLLTFLINGRELLF